jgi:uncharacterized protein YjbJ (UPF0337 family)
MHALETRPQGCTRLGVEDHAREKLMNWDQIEGKWKQHMGKAKERWGKLTDDDLRATEGRKEQLIGLIQERYGIAKEVAQKQVDEFMHSFREETAVEQQGQTERHDKAFGKGR